MDDPAKSGVIVDDGSFTLREALHTRTFWVLSGTHTLANLAVGAISAHLVLHLTDIGIPDLKAAGVIPIFVGIAFFAQLGGGFIGDKLDKRLILSTGLVIQSISVIVLAYATSYSAAVIFALLWGVGFGGRGPILHALRGDYFGSRYFGSILGIASFPMILGMTATPVLAGLAFDLQDTYKWVFLTTATTGFMASILVLFAKRPVRPTRHGVPESSGSPTVMPTTGTADG
jgi:MFS family permease